MNSDFDSVPEQPWPQKGDVLFTSASDWWHNSCLDFHSDNWETYIGGYKKAGDALVEHIKNDRIEQDYLVFPIVFVYRQYLELRLKKLIIDCKQLFDDRSEFPKVHDLKRLWVECKPLLQKLEHKLSAQDLEAVSESIQQFCELDPSSEAFRYPINKKGKKSLPLNLQHINVRNLADIMGKLSAFFDAVAMTVLEYLDYKQEMEAYYRDDSYE
jgi:hypothetical protein